MWGVGVQKNPINEKIDIKIQLFGISEQLKDIQNVQPEKRYIISMRVLLNLKLPYSADYAQLKNYLEVPE